MEKSMINSNADADLGLTEEQMRRIEERFRERSRNEHKRSIDKRSSIKIKSTVKEAVPMTRQEIDLVQSWANLLENVEQHVELIDELCQKKKINFLNQLKGKISTEEYKMFLSGLELYKLPEGGRLQEQGKYHNYHYIIIEGCIAAYREKKAKEEQKELVQAFEYEIGEVLISNTLQTHKSNPYTNRAKRLSLLLRFSEETFNKHLKRVCQKEFDELASVLSHNLLFRGITALEMKKYLPYCSFSRFKYNDLVYQEEDRIIQLFIILEGQVEISYEKDERSNQNAKNSLAPPLGSPNLYRLSHQYKEKKEIKIVRVGKGQLFGLQSAQVYEQNYYQHHVRVTSNVLKVLSMSLQLLYEIQTQNPLLSQNMQAYLKKVMSMHARLLERHHNATTLAPIKKKPKKNKKKKIKRKPEISLEWWGLAEKLEGSKKYRMPTPPKSKSQQNLIRKEPLLLQQRTNKLDYFKRRLFEDQIEGLEEAEQKENGSPTYPSVLIPKLQKVKIQMINPKPKVINNAQRIKRKLVDYAKNGQVFCDKLQLQ